MADSVGAAGDGLVDASILGMLEDRIGRDAVLRIVKAQLTFGAQVLTRLDVLLVTPDPKATRQISHQMAGSSSSVGLLRLGEAAASLEMALLDDEGYAGLTQEVTMLRALVQASIAELSRLYPEA